MTIPTFKRSKRLNQLGFCIDIDESGFNGIDETWKAIQSVRIDSIAARFGKQAPTKFGTFVVKTGLCQNFPKCFGYDLERKSFHEEE